MQFPRFFHTGALVGRLQGNNTRPNETITASSEFDESHGKHKLNIYNEDPPAAWCPSE